MRNRRLKFYMDGVLSLFQSDYKVKDLRDKKIIKDILERDGLDLDRINIYNDYLKAGRKSTEKLRELMKDKLRS